MFIFVNHFKDLMKWNVSIWTVRYIVAKLESIACMPVCHASCPLLFRIQLILQFSDTGTRKKQRGATYEIRGTPFGRPIHLPGNPTDPSIILEPQNPSIDVSVLHKIRRSPDLEAQKSLWKGWLGTDITQHPSPQSLFLSCHISTYRALLFIRKKSNQDIELQLHNTQGSRLVERKQLTKTPKINECSNINCQEGVSYLISWLLFIFWETLLRLIMIQHRAEIISNCELWVRQLIHCCTYEISICTKFTSLVF